MRWHRNLSRGLLRKQHPNQLVDEDLVVDLARLYAPIEGLEQMTRFESVLRERRQTQPHSEQLQPKRRLSPRWGVTGLAVVAVAVAAAVVAVALPSGGRSTSIAEAQQFLLEIPDRLDVPAGQVFYQRVEVYWRYGPRASEIIAGTGIPTENHVRESWELIGENQTVDESRGHMMDDSGTVLETTEFKDGVMTASDPRTGEDITDGQPIVVEGKLDINGPRDRAAAYMKQLADGSTTVISQSDSQLVLETTTPASDRDRERVYDPGEFSVPFFVDLKPIEFISRETIEADGTVSLQEVHAVTQTGERVLIQSWRITDKAILDRMP